VAGAIGGGLSGLFDDPCANLGDVAKRGAISGAIDGALGGAGAAAKAGALATKAKAAAEAEAKASAAAAKAAAESRSASSANAVRLNQQLTSQEIAGGHAFDKHVIERAEFPEVSTRQQFAEHIENVINNPTASKQLNNGRSVFWDDATGTVVIRNPKAADGGTAFRPTQGKSYFDGLK
jgi:filamentous hemagglutinin